MFVLLMSASQLKSGKTLFEFVGGFANAEGEMFPDWGRSNTTFPH
jgi:hypothetical protein